MHVLEKMRFAPLGIRRKKHLAQGADFYATLRTTAALEKAEVFIDRIVPMLTDHTVAHLLDAAQICDGLVKGLKHPDWPFAPWDGEDYVDLPILVKAKGKGLWEIIYNKDGVEKLKE